MRPKRERHLALLIVDEFKAYADEMTGLILSDARQFGMGMLIASQQPHQLPEGVRREINTNTSIRFMGNIEYSIAAQYARDMFCEPEFILGMKKYDRSHAEWAAYVSGMDHAVKVDMPYGAIERMPKARESLRIMTSANVTPAQKLTPPQLYEEPEPGADEYLYWMQREMERAEAAGDWPKDDEKVPDDERAKDNEVPEGVIKPGKSWD